MRFGVFSSLVLHLAIVAASFYSLLPSWRPAVLPEPYVPVELIREADLDLTTSVPAARSEPETVEEPEPEIEETPEPVVEEEPAPKEETPEPEPAPVPEQPTPEPDPEPVKPEPVVKPEPENDDLDLDALSALIDKSKDTERQTAPRETSSDMAETADKPRAAIGAGDRLTASDEAKMRAAMYKCWNTSSIIGAPNAEKLVVEIDFELKRDGSLASPPRVANSLQINLSGNKFWRVAEQSALRAVVSCAPYDFLPQERYESWKEFRLNFDPSVLVGR